MEEKLELREKLFSDLNTDDIFSKATWRQNSIKVYGKEHPEPRLTAWYGPAYKYSNIQWESCEIPEFLMPLMDSVKSACNFNFNAALLNYYRNGQDSMGWHSDDEHEIDHSCIASLSLGASRKFKLKHKENNLKQEITLDHGSLLIMRHYQKNWKHAVPKTKKVLTPRLNITFRKIREL